MQRLKAIVLTAVFLAIFDSLSSAEVVMMSLKGAMRQSDAVVVGMIEEVHQTDAGVEGQFPPPVTHWLATCRVERYIKGPQIHKPGVEEAKSVSIIHIAFIQKMQLPAPLELGEGKKYLLFLKETGPNEYEMITPYHGAVEPGQTHNLYDEQNPSARLSFEEIVQRITPQDSASVDIHDQPDRKLSEDELRMKERLIALSRGEGDVADLRVEVMDGNPMTLTGMRIYNIADGKVVSQEWASIGSPEKRGERAVTDEEIRRLLQTLIEHQYWTFQGTQFIPDAPGFMFRFYYKDLPPVEYRCEAHEYEPSAQLSAIRSLWVSFVSGASPQNQVSCEAQGGRWGRFGLMEKEQCNRPTTDAGKECSDHSECESDCVTEDTVPAGAEVRGKCFEWTVTLGTCLNGVKDGKAQGVICED